MTTIEDAARNLVTAELQRVRAEQIRQAVYDTLVTANEAYDQACEQVKEATAELVAAVSAPPEERVVKRPAETAGTLLDLDDVGGR